MYDQTGTIIDRREMLRVKFNSLMAEAAIIRKEENRLKYRRPKGGELSSEKRMDARPGIRRPVPCPMLLRELQMHRTKDVRYHARLTHLALGFIKGRTLPEMERYPVNLLLHSQWDAIMKMVAKYGNPVALARLKEQRDLYQGKVYATKPAFVKKETSKQPFTRPDNFVNAQNKAAAEMLKVKA